MRFPSGLLLGGLVLAAGTLSLAGAQPPGQPTVLPGEKFTPPARGERQKDGLQVGDRAPDFTLPLAYGTKEMTLSSYQGKKPVVLIFGSCT